MNRHYTQNGATTDPATFSNLPFRLAVVIITKTGGGAGAGKGWEAVRLWGVFLAGAQPLRNTHVWLLTGKEQFLQAIIVLVGYPIIEFAKFRIIK